MKNLSRHLFLGLAGVCVIALCVFLVQLIIINSGTEPADPESLVTEGTDQIGENQPGEGEPNVPWTPDPGDQTPRPPPSGVRTELPVDSDTAVIIYEDSENFDHITNEFDWRFDYKGGGNAALVISFVYLTPQGVAEDAEGFLNAYIDGDTAEYKGIQPMIDSSLTSCYSVEAKKDGVSYEAWLYPLPDNNRNLALAFLIYYEFNSQQDALYDLLSSVSVENISQG